MEAPERFDPQATRGRLIEAEHLARYWWAAALVPGKRVLDAGCGTAYGSEILARAGASEVIGGGLDAAVVEAARASTQTVSLEAAAVGDLPQRDGAFDAAGCSVAIQHVSGPE